MASDVDRAPEEGASRRAQRWLRSFIPWGKGAAAELTVGQELEALRHEGYVVMHDFMLGNERNVDHVVAGPNGVFMIETTFSDHDEVHLAKAKRQARKLHDEIGCWVTPVICSSERTFVREGVLVAERGRLADAIRAQPRRRPVESDRLARFADFLD
ncbi:MAG TPA: nuclease-related domain-containing protein [Gaiellaceae bacterium]|nr:nuclease-related domain-containing protein [Gaiellaceae bacterium]